MQDNQAIKSSNLSVKSPSKCQLFGEEIQQNQHHHSSNVNTYQDYMQKYHPFLKREAQNDVQSNYFQPSSQFSSNDSRNNYKTFPLSNNQSYDMYQPLLFNTRKTQQTNIAQTQPQIRNIFDYQNNQKQLIQQQNNQDQLEIEKESSPSFGNSPQRPQRIPSPDTAFKNFSPKITQQTQNQILQNQSNKENNQNNMNNSLQVANTNLLLQQQQQLQKLDDIDYRLQNRIIPIIEDRILNSYIDDKEQWVLEVVEIIREFKEKNISGEHIFNKNYGMLFEQLYDGFLTLQRKNKKDYQFVLNLIKRTMRDIDKIVIKYYHDYRRIRGEKLQFNRETEQKVNTQIPTAVIKIEEPSNAESEENSATIGCRSETSEQVRILNDTNTNMNNSLTTNVSIQSLSQRNLVKNLNFDDQFVKMEHK